MLADSEVADRGTRRAAWGIVELGVIAGILGALVSLGAWQTRRDRGIAEERRVDFVRHPPAQRCERCNGPIETGYVTARGRKTVRLGWSLGEPTSTGGGDDILDQRSSAKPARAQGFRCSTCRRIWVDY